MGTALRTVRDIKKAVADAIAKAQRAGALIQADIPEFIVEVPADRSHGDFASNAAMAGARSFRTSPVKIADAIIDNISFDGTLIERCEKAGPGFINFFVKPEYYLSVIRDIERDGKNYGRSDFGQGRKVMVEFVSANPTGPMHMGNARGGAIGDCLASVLDAAGFDTWREFYVNDAGNQIDKFARSLEARYLMLYKNDIVFPEDGYQGGDIIDHAKEFSNIYGDKYVDSEESERRKALVDYALPLNIKKMQDDIAKYKIVYDRWFFESTLHDSGEVREVIDLLSKAGLTYEKDGALWYKNSEVISKKLLAEGKSQKDIDKLELKDDVLVRQNGTPTYFAADIAYHRNKFVKRGFDICIDIWGADHHGHVARMKGAMDSVGVDSSNLKVILMQLVNLMQDGKPVRMSKRTGKAIQLADLLDEVPIDSARFMFNTREVNVPMDFDLDLAVKQDSQNPVYYVQYAHARICSIIRALAADGINERRCSDDELLKLTAPEEKELINLLAEYESNIISAASNYDPTVMTKYVTQTAAQFHKFYNSCRVKGNDMGLTQARLSLCIAAKTVISNVLTMLKIDTPESM